METKISNRLIRRFKPCYDPFVIVKDEEEELPVKEWVIKYGTDVPAKDVVWLLLHKEFMSDRDMRFFAVWCARESLKLLKNPDPRSISACDIAEKYANGDATAAELSAAYAAAADAAYASASASASAAYASAYAAYAAASAAYAAAADAAYASADAAVYAARADAAYASASASAASASASASASAKNQLTQLLTYL